MIFTSDRLGNDAAFSLRRISSDLLDRRIISVDFRCDYVTQNQRKKNRWLIFGIGLFLLISELYKQLFYTYVVGEGSYQYDRIPFQLCSIPMYVCLIVPWLKEGKAKRALYTFTGSFGFMGGFVSYFRLKACAFPIGRSRSTPLPGT